MNGLIWWFAADPEFKVPHFWQPKAIGDTWDESPTVFKIEVSM